MCVLLRKNTYAVPGSATDMKGIFHLDNNELLFRWRKPSGGDAIDNYVVSWSENEISSNTGSSGNIFHIPGIEYYCYVFKVKPTAVYNMEILTTNSASSTRTSDQIGEVVFLIAYWSSFVIVSASLAPNVCLFTTPDCSQLKNLHWLC